MTLLFFIKPKWHLAAAGEAAGETGFPVYSGYDKRTKKAAKKVTKEIEEITKEIDSSEAKTLALTENPAFYTELNQRIESLDAKIAQYRMISEQKQMIALKERAAKIEDLQKKIKMIIAVMLEDDWN